MTNVLFAKINFAIVPARCSFVGGIGLSIRVLLFSNVCDDYLFGNALTSSLMGHGCGLGQFKI